MEKIRLQLAKAIDNTYITYFLLTKPSPNKALQTYRNQAKQSFADKQYIKKYYPKNESIKYLSIIKLHLSISFFLKISPNIIGNYRNNIIRLSTKSKIIKLKNVLQNKREINKDKDKPQQYKELNNELMIYTKHTRNKSSNLPKISKRSFSNNNSNQSNSKSNLQNNLSSGLSSLPEYQDYTKVFSAFVFGKYGKLIKNNGNLKEIDKISIFRKYLIETKKNLMNKKTKHRMNLKMIKQSLSKHISTSRSNQAKSKLLTNVISHNSMLDLSSNDKRNENSSIISPNKSAVLNNLSKNNSDMLKKYTSDKSLVDHSDKCVGNDDYIIREEDKSLLKINSDSSSSCKIKLYDVIFKYKNNLPFLNKLKKTPSLKSPPGVKQVYIKNPNSHQIYYKANDGRIYLPKIKLIEKNKALKEREAYFVSKLENAFIKSCFFNNLKID